MRAVAGRRASQMAPATIITTLISCGLGEAERDVVVAADELDQQALEPREDQVEGEQEPAGEPVAQAPQHEGDSAHRQRLVDRRRVHLLGRRHGPVGVGHRPGAVPLLAVVAVARELAADAPDRVAQGQRGRREVEQGGAEVAAPPRPEEDAEGAADQPPEPDQPRAREDVAQQVVGGLVPVLDDPVEPGADQAAGQRRRTPSRTPSRPACRAPSGACRSARPPRGRRARSRARRSAGSGVRSRSRAARTAEASRAVGSGPMHDLLLALLALLSLAGAPASSPRRPRGPGSSPRSRRRPRCPGAAAGVRAACSSSATRSPWGRRRTWPRRCRGGGSRSWPGPRSRPRRGWRR